MYWTGGTDAAVTHSTATQHVLLGPLIHAEWLPSKSLRNSPPNPLYQLHALLMYCVCPCSARVTFSCWLCQYSCPLVLDVRLYDFSNSNFVAPPKCSLQLLWLWHTTEMKKLPSQVQDSTCIIASCEQPPGFKPS